MKSVSACALLTLLFAQSAGTRQRTPQQIGTDSSNGDWPIYRHDLAGTGYSPLTQIDTGNVAKLSRVWSYSLQSDAPAAAARGGRVAPVVRIPRQRPSS